jgi:hypothetical protein
LPASIRNGLDILPGLKAEDSYCAGLGVRRAHTKTFAIVFLDIDDVLCLNDPFGGLDALECVAAKRLDVDMVFDILPGLKAEDSYCAGLGVRRAHTKTFASVGSCFDGAARFSLATEVRLTSPPQAAGL